MDRPRKRSRFQFHLSTAIWLTIASGVVLWLNFRGFVYTVGEDAWGRFGTMTYGVPFFVAEQNVREAGGKWTPIGPMHLSEWKYWIFNGLVFAGLFGCAVWYVGTQKPGGK